MQFRDDYLAADYPRDEDELRRARAGASDAMATVASAEGASGEIPYALPIDDTPQQFSASTTAMVLHALAVAGGLLGPPQSVLFPWHPDPTSLALLTARLGHPASAADADEDTVDKRVAALKSRLRTRFIALRDKPPYSASWGDRDPLTLSWLYELRSIFEHDSDWQAVDKVLQPAIRDALQRLTKNGPPLYVKDQARRSKGPTFVDHAFPLLRLIHLFCLVKSRPSATGSDTSAVFLKLKPKLVGRMHTQLSLSDISGAAFDAGELVFPLEALLQLDPKWYDRDLIDRVFAVLSRTQRSSAYWRPLNPISVTRAGLVLLPQSIEISNSLLRICQLIGLRSESRPFSDNVELFQCYAQWLLARVVTLPGPKRLVGWESEHTQQGNTVHIWHTSQVLLFLLGYSAMLKQHIASAAVRSARITVSRPLDGHLGLDAKALRAFRLSEPVKTRVPDYLPAYRRLIDGFDLEHGGSRRRWTSAILYGPPGTGKTSTAKAIARILHWPLITVTPGDFIAKGQEGLEARAQIIFTTLGLVTNHVVFFDEMDQLMLDRESDLYGHQNDVFKLLTPSMLTKMADLVGHQENIYLIATNYFDRIDRAVSRPGRIDACVPILPPDMGGRRHFLGLQIDGNYGDIVSKPRGTPVWRPADPSVDRLVRQTSLYTYAELESLVRDASRISRGSSVGPLISKCATLSEQSPRRTVTVKAYRSRTDLSDQEGGTLGYGGREQLLLRAQLECALVAYVWADGQGKFEKGECDWLAKVLMAADGYLPPQLLARCRSGLDGKPRRASRAPIKVAPPRARSSVRANSSVRPQGADPGIAGRRG